MTTLETSEQSDNRYDDDPRTTDANTLTLSDHGPFELYVRTTEKDKGWLTLTDTRDNSILLDHEVDAPLDDDGMVAYEVWVPWFTESEDVMFATGYEPLDSGHPSV